MPPVLIDQDASLESILEHLIHTPTQLQRYELTAPLAEPFEKMIDRWLQTQRLEVDLWIQILRATVLVGAADDDLDVLVDALSTTILAENGNNREAGVYLAYFGNKTPGELKRPVLGGQIDAMAAFVEPLRASTSPALRALGDRIDTAVKRGEGATKGLNSARQRNREFRTAGERKAFIDALNELRKSTYGTLAGMPHKYPERNLPNTFAEQFYKRAPRKKASTADEEPRTAVELAAKIAQIEEQLAALKERYTHILATEETAARDRIQREADEAALAEAEKMAQEAQTRAAQLRAKLGR